MTMLRFSEEYVYQKEMENSFHPADIVEIDFKERTLVPKGIVHMNNMRGVIEEVLVGYDIYETEDCMSKTNDHLFYTIPLPDGEIGVSQMLGYELFGGYVLCETIIPNSLYKLTFDTVNEGKEESTTLYYKQRKYVYKVQFPLVHYPLLGKPSYSFAIHRDIEEEYLTKVGNTFQQTPLIKPKTFKERLLYQLENGFRKRSIFHGSL